jgi:hypothetical protein
VAKLLQRLSSSFHQGLRYGRHLLTHCILDSLRAPGETTVTTEDTKLDLLRLIIGKLDRDGLLDRLVWLESAAQSAVLAAAMGTDAGHGTDEMFAVMVFVKLTTAAALAAAPLA